MHLLKLNTGDRPSPEKFAGFDAIRAFAALGVVLLHACVPYLKHPMPGLVWPVRDTTSVFVDVLFWGIELFIMPVFLVLAGILAWRTLDRRGERAVITSRASRLLIPLLFGVLVVLPMDMYAWLLGFVTEGLMEPVKLRSLKLGAELNRDLWGLSHLWFLHYLFLYVVCLAGANWILTRYPKLQRFTRSNLGMLCLLLTAGIVTLVFRPEVVWGFQHAFLPVPSKWIYSGTFFAGGVLLAKCDPGLIKLRTDASRLAAPAILLSLFSIVLGRWHLAGSENQTASVLLAALTTVSAWLGTLAIIGITIDRVKNIPIAVQYLAAASFWVYVIHHPFLGLIHTDLKWLLPSALPATKTFLAFAICTGLSLLMYEGLVRKSRLGRWLGFAWEIPMVEEPPEHVLPIEDAPATEVPARRAA